MSRKLSPCHERKTPAPALAAAVNRLNHHQTLTELLQHTLRAADLRRSALLQSDGVNGALTLTHLAHGPLPLPGVTLPALPWLAEQLHDGKLHCWHIAELPPAAQTERAYWASLQISAVAWLPVPLANEPHSAWLLAEASTPQWTEQRLATLELAAAALAELHRGDALRETLRNTRGELSSLREQLSALDPHDPLTGVLCRETLEANLCEEVARAVREGTPLSLVLTDIDQFADYHLDVGTEAGNYCLQQIAATLAGAFERAGERVGRWDKECFAVLMPGLEPVKAERAARRLSATLNARQLGNGWSAGNLNFRLGVATVRPSAAMGVEQLVELAELALQEARNHDLRMVCKHWV